MSEPSRKICFHASDPGFDLNPDLQLSPNRSKKIEDDSNKMEELHSKHLRNRIPLARLSSSSRELYHCGWQNSSRNREFDVRNIQDVNSHLNPLIIRSQLSAPEVFGQEKLQRPGLRQRTPTSSQTMACNGFGFSSRSSSLVLSSCMPISANPSPRRSSMAENPMSPQRVNSRFSHFAGCQGSGEHPCDGTLYDIAGRIARRAQLLPPEGSRCSGASGAASSLSLSCSGTPTECEAILFGADARRSQRPRPVNRSLRDLRDRPSDPFPRGRDDAAGQAFYASHLLDHCNDDRCDDDNVARQLEEIELAEASSASGRTGFSSSGRIVPRAGSALRGSGAHLAVHGMSESESGLAQVPRHSAACFPQAAEPQLAYRPPRFGAQADRCGYVPAGRLPAAPLNSGSFSRGASGLAARSRRLERLRRIAALAEASLRRPDAQPGHGPGLAPHASGEEGGLACESARCGAAARWPYADYGRGSSDGRVGASCGPGAWHSSRSLRVSGGSESECRSGPWLSPLPVLSFSNSETALCSPSRSAGSQRLETAKAAAISSREVSAAGQLRHGTERAKPGPKCGDDYMPARQKARAKEADSSGGGSYSQDGGCCNNAGRVISELESSQEAGFSEGPLSGGRSTARNLSVQTESHAAAAASEEAVELAASSPAGDGWVDRFPKGGRRGSNASCSSGRHSLASTATKFAVSTVTTQKDYIDAGHRSGTALLAAAFVRLGRLVLCLPKREEPAP